MVSRVDRGAVVAEPDVRTVLDSRTLRFRGIYAGGRPKRKRHVQGVRVCPDHGYFDASDCPVCGASGDLVLSGSRRTQLSKFTSGALRHFPEDVGIALDDGGWTDVDVLLARTAGRYEWFDDEMLESVVATDPKGRFELDGDRVRATYGHSVAVDLESTDDPVPDVLYHGTAPETVDAILSEGIRAMDRQHVHLSDTVGEATTVGERHAADPAILRVDAAGLIADGRDVTKRGTRVYTTDRVPPAYVTATDRGE